MPDGRVFLEETSLVRSPRVPRATLEARLSRRLRAMGVDLREVHATEDQLRASLFGDDPKVFCHIAEVDGEIAGFALWFLNFSTWLGTHGVYLEDLYVRPELRGRGVGAALLHALARICVVRGYPRMDWAVLDWNRPAIGFYKRLGAKLRRQWILTRLTGAPLRRLAR